MAAHARRDDLPLRGCAEGESRGLERDHGTDTAGRTVEPAGADPVRADVESKPNRTVVLTATGAITPTTGGALQNKVNDTNHSYYVLDYDAGTDESAFWHFVMPDSYDGGNINVTLYWLAAATSGNAVLAVQTAGVADGESYDAALGSAQSVTDAAKASANQLNTATVTAFSPGWSDGDEIIFKVFRDADNASDTMSGDLRLVKAKIEYSADQESD